MPDRDSENNFVKVVGSPEGVKAAIAAIKELISIGISSITHEGHSMQSMTIPRNMVMYLIGEKGSKIRKLEEQTGTKINTQIQGSNIVNVTITGPVEVTARSIFPVMPFICSFSTALCLTCFVVTFHLDSNLHVTEHQRSS